jgi:hypothetical protein
VPRSPRSSFRSPFAHTRGGIGKECAICRDPVGVLDRSIIPNGGGIFDDWSISRVTQGTVRSSLPEGASAFLPFDRAKMPPHRWSDHVTDGKDSPRMSTWRTTTPEPRDFQRAQTVFWQVDAAAQSVDVTVAQVAGAAQSSEYDTREDDARQGAPTGACSGPLQM